ncbi:response regulator [bacterium]|nr:response regulator [bacterium]
MLCIHQDHEGFMWFGTQNGLNQFDGYRYRIFQYDPSDSCSISANQINCILEDREGYLWIGTDAGGLNRYNKLFNQFKHYRADIEDSTQLPDDFIGSLFQDSHDRLWIGTSEGVSQYHRETDSFTHLSIQAFVKAICEDSQGNLWFGTGFNGVYKYHPDTHHMVHYMHHPSQNNTLGANTIETIVEDASNHIWIGTIDGGLNLYERRNDSFIVFSQETRQSSRWTSKTIFSLYCDRSGNLWAGYENAGLSRVLMDTLKVGGVTRLQFEIYHHEVNDIQSLSNNTVRSIFEDNQGNLWIGTYYGGVNLFRRHKKQFQNYHSEPYNDQGLNHDVIQTFLEDPAGNIWIGTDGGGLNYFDRKTGIFTKYMHEVDDPYSISDNHILDLHQEGRGNIWVATWNGLNYFDLNTKRFYSYFHQENDPGSLISNKVTAVLEDFRGLVWIGTTAGLTLFDPVKNAFFQFDAEKHANINTRYIHSILQDSKKNLWIATVHGLYLLPWDKLRNEQWDFVRYVNEDQDSINISVNHFLSVYEDHLGIVWLGTIDGLCYYHPGQDRFGRYSMTDGLNTNMIFSVVEDLQGNLWMGTNKGISHFTRQNQHFRNYGIHDGLMSDAFTKAALRCRSGELMLGGKTGFTLFYPDRIKESTYIPPIVLTDFQIFDHSTPLGRVLKKVHSEKADSMVIELAYNENMISFEFAALDFTAPQKNRYQYMLEGFDEQWRKIDADRRFATYTNLSAGHYVFRVLGSNCDGVWNRQGLAIGVVIHPPFWRTSWALLVYIGFIISVLMMFKKLVAYREKLKNEVLMERREAERIHEVDAMRLRFFTNISHEFRTPLTLIIGLLERLMRFKKSIGRSELLQNFLIMQRNAKRLLRLINQIMDIRKLDEGCMPLNLKHRDIVHFIRSIYSSFKYQAEQRNIQYRFETSIDQFSMWFDPDKVDKIVYNLLSNAFKYTKNGGNIDIKIHIPVSMMSGTQNHSVLVQGLEIKIQDDGIGIAKDDQEKVFDPFYQVLNAGEQASKGTGIGLSLTKELVLLHQGDIRLESHSGEGACFTVTLPTHLIPDNIYEAEYPVEEELYPVLPKASVIHQKIHMENHNGPLILVVDDDIDFCNYLRDELSSDYRVIEVTSGDMAYEKSMEFMPDLIVSDVKMPKMDGFTLCTLIKNNDRTSHIPVILLTSKTGEKNQMAGYDHGADGYIMKPFDITFLRKRITNLLNSRKKLKERFSHEIYLQPKNVVITSEQERFLKNVFDVIETNLEDPDFSVSQLGYKIGLSRVQLYRKIKNLTELTPNDLIKNFRLKRAAQLLRESQLTVLEITYETGFKDPSYFCKCFKQLYGSSPREYVKEQKFKSIHTES